MTAIFPIIRSSRINQEEHICGTGFLVSRQGHFFTCSHVIGSGTWIMYSAAADLSDLKNRVSLEFIFRSKRKDIFFGKLSKYIGPLLTLVDCGPKSGGMLRIVGYTDVLVQSQSGVYASRSLKEPDPIEAAHLANVDRCDIPEGTYDNIRRPCRKFSAVISSGSVPDGYSGAPVIDAMGRVVAMHCGTCSHPTINNGDPIMVHVSARELRRVLRRKAT
jgi:trypsin-like peptidase